MLLRNKIKKEIFVVYGVFNFMKIEYVIPLNIAFMIVSNIYTKFAEGGDIQNQGDMCEYLNLRTKMKRTIHLGKQNLTKPHCHYKLKYSQNTIIHIH